MNEKVLHTLEFDKIINKLQEFATCDAGRKSCGELKPVSDINVIKSMQRETSDALVRILRSGSISFSGTRDITDTIKRLEIGASLGIKELLNIGSVLSVANRAKSYGRKEESKADDSIDYMFEALSPLTPLKNDIERCIVSEDEISDEASPALKSIRRHI